MKKINELLNILTDPFDFRAILFYGMVLAIGIYTDAIYYGWYNWIN